MVVTRIRIMYAFWQQMINRVYLMIRSRVLSCGLSFGVYNMYRSIKPVNVSRQVMNTSAAQGTVSEKKL